MSHMVCIYFDFKVAAALIKMIYCTKIKAS